jgi:hypothetical protein
MALMLFNTLFLATAKERGCLKLLKIVKPQ